MCAPRILGGPERGRSLTGRRRRNNEEYIRKQKENVPAQAVKGIILRTATNEALDAKHHQCIGESQEGQA